MNSMVSTGPEIATAAGRDIEMAPIPLRLTLIPGQTGAGAALAVVRVLEGAGVPVSWELVRTTAGKLDENVEAVAKSLNRTGLGLKGISGEIGTEFVGALEERLKVTTTLQPISFLFPARGSVAPRCCVVFEEGRHVLYSGFECEVAEGMIERIKVASRNVYVSLVSEAFEFAEAFECRTVHAVHDLDLSSACSRLFLDCCREVAARHPRSHYQERPLDEACRALAGGRWAPEVVVATGGAGRLLSAVAEGLWPNATKLVGGQLGPNCGLFELSGNDSLRAGREEEHMDALAITWAAFLLAFGAGKREAAARLRPIVWRILAERSAPLETDAMFGSIEAVFRELYGTPPDSTTEDAAGIM